MTALRQRAVALGVTAVALTAAAVGVPIAHGALTTGITNTTNSAASGIFTNCAKAAYGTGGTSAAAFTLPMNETAGTTATDISGNARNGTYSSSGISYAQTRTSCPRDTPLRAAAFNGTSGDLYDNSAINDPETFSLEIWFKAASGCKGKLIGLSGSTNPTTAGLSDRMLYIGATGKLFFAVNNGAFTTVSNAVSVCDSAWHQAVGTYSATTGMALYLDGASVTSKTISPTGLLSYNGYWHIGASYMDANWPDRPSQNAYLAATLSFASVYYSVLTGPQVAAHFAAGSS